jgi:hypothetical protein
MRRRSSPFRKGRALALLVALAAWGSPSRAWAQACCAGGSVVTPGRLELHEDALVGVQLKAATVLGSYDPSGRYAASPAGDTEGDFEQDLFGAVRLLRRGQVALLVPIVETQRKDTQDPARFGGGLGDVNLGARYDFVVAGESRYVPGVALLGGLTFPTGKAPDAFATPAQVIDTTGVGVFQANAAVAAEQTFGPWLVNATGLLAVRTARSGEQLAPQVTLLAAVAYTLPSDAALALSASYTFEGEATLDGASLPASSRRVTVVTLSGLWPVTDAWRLLGGLYIDPPIDRLGSNQPAVGGLTLTVIRSWS